jgi:hypothetical protein
MKDSSMKFFRRRYALIRNCYLPLVSLSMAMFSVTSFVAMPCAAQLCVQLYGAAHIQNFNTLPVSGSSNNGNTTMPIGFAFSESGPGNNGTYAANNGALGTVNTYSYGTGTTTDRALGELSGFNSTASFVSTLGACFVNATGFKIDSFSISYTGEQWRLGAADGFTDRLDFEFSTDAIALNDEGEPGRLVTWTPVNSLDFSSPTNTGAVGALDGNAAANRTAKGPIAIIPADGLPFGSIMFIRWLPTDLRNVPADVDVPDDGLAIDDFKMTYQMSADFDQDQDVDGKDFLHLQRGLGKKTAASVSDGDANKDGAIDAIDSLLWRTQFGTTRDAPPQFAAVPEPACATLAALVIAAVAGRARKCA